VVDRNAVIILSGDFPVIFPLLTSDCLLTTLSYVAMHAMQEDAGHHDHSGSNGYTEGAGVQKKPPRPQVRDTIAAVGGMLIPLLTQIGHHH
jgi:hypothetical protein